MRGVSMPSHEYARLAEQCLYNPGPQCVDIIEDCASSTLAYSRVVVRLRAQAEAAEAEYIVQHIPGAPFSNGPVSAYSRTMRQAVRQSSRAPSPAMSTHSQSHPGQSSQQTIRPPQASTPQGATPFRSPLYKLRRAPLLRAFVPSPDGDWLSDTSVLECEAQMKRAGVTKLLRPGDVVWDMAVGDEGNLGRLVWDGNFLIVSNCCVSTACLHLIGSCAGPRLLIYSGGGSPAILTHPLFPPVILPSCYTYEPGQYPARKQPSCPYRHQSLGRRGRC